MKIAIIQYSTYGHTTQLARAAKAGIEESGLATAVDIFQVQETLSNDILEKLHAGPKPKDIPVATLETLEEYDAFIFGVPTRFGTGSAQFFEFWGATGGLWMKGALNGKPAGFIVSVGTQGGGQEETVRHSINYLAHHGMPYIPLGYAKTFADVTADEVHGGTPYGAGTFADADGSRQPSELELRMAKVQGNDFAASAIKFVRGKKTSAADDEPEAPPAASDIAKKAAQSGTAATAGAATTAGGVVDKTKAGVQTATEKAQNTASDVADKAKSAKATATQRAEQSKKTAETEEKGFCSKCVIM